MPKHTGMSQEKKNTDTKEWCSHSHVGGSEFPKRGTAPSPSPPARRRLRGSAAGHARLLAASDAAVFPPPRAYRRTVALGGGGFRGPWRAGTRGPAAPFRSLPRLCRRLASPRRCARLIPRDWQAAQRAGAGAGAGCRPATRPPSEQRSSVARSHSFFTPDLSLWTLSRSLPGLSRRPKVRTASPAGQAGSVSAGPTHSQREAHTQTHTHTHIQAHAGRHTHTHADIHSWPAHLHCASLRFRSACFALFPFRPPPPPPPPPPPSPSPPPIRQCPIWQTCHAMPARAIPYRTLPSCLSLHAYVYVGSKLCASLPPREYWSACAATQWHPTLQHARAPLSPLPLSSFYCFFRPALSADACPRTLCWVGVFFSACVCV